VFALSRRKSEGKKKITISSCENLLKKKKKNYGQSQKIVPQKCPLKAEHRRNQNPSAL
jgi:hypothetical protein